MSQSLGNVRGDLALLPCGDSVHPDVVDRYINNRYQAVLSAFPWTRLKIDGAIQSVALYSTGTIEILNGGQTFTITDGTFTLAMQDRKIRIAGREEYYTFTFIDADEGSIDAPYEGEDAEEATFEIFQNVFALPEPMKEISSIKVPQLMGDLDQVSVEYLDEIDPNRRNAFGMPYCYAPAQDSSGFIRQIELYPVPTAAESYPVSGKRSVARLVNDLDQFLPWVSVEAIFAGVEADLLRLKGDRGAALDKDAQFMSLLADMKAEDTRRMPKAELRLSDSFTQYRKDRTTRGGKVRNWNSA